jgi:hypothetical protein
VAGPTSGRHPFPDNSHLRAEAARHAHLVIPARADHFDVESVRGFPKTTRVIVPAFPSRTLAGGLSALGFTGLIGLLRAALLGEG